MRTGLVSIFVLFLIAASTSAMACPSCDPVRADAEKKCHALMDDTKVKVDAAIASYQAKGKEIMEKRIAKPAK